ncbi:MAG: hypothetical protein ACREQ3_23635, partial [Candidatus Binatia bacterium]
MQEYPHESVGEAGRASLTQPDSPPVIEPGYTFASVTEKISSIALTRRTPRGWFIGFGLAFMLAMLLLSSIGYLLVAGI